MPINSSDDSPSNIFTQTILSQISASLRLASPGSTPTNIYSSNARFNQIYSTASHGTSLSSFGRQVLSWQSSSLLLVSGTRSDDDNSSSPILLCAYLPAPWKDSSNTHSSTPTAPLDQSAPQPCMLQLLPRHSVFPVNPYTQSPTTPASYFSTKTSIALGCVIPPQSRTGPALPPIPSGPVSLYIDADISTGTFTHDPDSGAGAYTLDPHLATSQCATGKPTSAKSTSPILFPSPQPGKLEFEIDTLEVWGIIYPTPGQGDDEMTKQQKRLAWEDAEAARRRGVNFGGDKDGARALLEMAGIVGDKAGGMSGGRSGGSV